MSILSNIIEKILDALDGPMSRPALEASLDRQAATTSERIAAIREKTEAASDSEVVRRALRLYESLLKAEAIVHDKSATRILSLMTNRDGKPLAVGTLDWRNSIVDLMKLTGSDSSLESRKALAMELGYTGKLDGSAEMNMWLHAQVMRELAR